MTDDSRYVEMTCSCAARWIEDRLESGPTCPGCGDHELWASLDDTDLFVQGPGQFDVSASHLIDLFKAWRFEGSLTRPKRGHVDVGTWTFADDEGDPAWNITIDVAVFKDTEVIRSVILTYHVDGRLVLSTTALTSEWLHELVAIIGRTWIPALVEAA